MIQTLFDAFKPLTPDVEREVQMQIEAYRATSHGLPTVAVLLEHIESDRFLLVASKDPLNGGKKNVGLVKGGIRKNEPLRAAGSREVTEELGISPSLVTFMGYGGRAEVRSLRMKKGHMYKCYFVLYAFYTGDPENITIDPKELLEYQWIVPTQLEDALSDIKERRPEKYAVIKHIFSMRR